MPNRLSYSQADGIATIQLDDGKANALGPEMVAEINDAFDKADKEAKAVILTGRPNRYCAGFDLKVMMSGPQAAKDLFELGGAMMLRVYTFPKPVVIACTGHALAGGALMLLVGDTRFGIKGDYKIGLNEVAIQMTLPVFAQSLAKAHLDPRQLTAATLHARIYSPDEAANVGYLDHAVEPDQLMDKARAEATRLGNLPGASYAATKSRLRHALAEHAKATMQEDMAKIERGE